MFLICSYFLRYLILNVLTQQIACTTSIFLKRKPPFPIQSSPPSIYAKNFFLLPYSSPPPPPISLIHGAFRLSDSAPPLHAPRLFHRHDFLSSFDSFSTASSFPAAAATTATSAAAPEIPVGFISSPPFKRIRRPLSERPRGQKTAAAARRLCPGAASIAAAATTAATAADRRVWRRRHRHPEFRSQLAGKSGAHFHRRLGIAATGVETADSDKIRRRQTDFGAVFQRRKSNIQGWKPNAAIGDFLI